MTSLRAALDDVIRMTTPGYDINPEYVEMARQRVAKIDGVQLELLR